MTEREQAIYLNALLYTLTYDISMKTPIVSKWMRHIRKGLIEMKVSEYNRVTQEVHNAWERARKAIIPKDSLKYVKMSEMLMALYNRIPSQHQNIYFTDKTFTKVVNSFESCHRNPTNELEYVNNARELANEFLKQIGVKTENTLLKRMRIINEQNKIMEGR